MKDIKYKILTLTATLLLTVSSCTDKFDAMNVDPNNPTAIGAQFLLPTALETSIDRSWGGRVRFERLNLDGTMLWMQYLARNIYSNEGDNYGISPAFTNNNWKAFFNDSQLNFQRIIVQSAPDGNAPNANYEGVALVMRSWVFSLMTDMWGAIPYSDALKGTATEPNYTPAYDSQEKVYAGLLADLKLANEKLSVTGPAISGDIVHNGDILKWKKFANSLRIRLANRQAAKKPAESRAIMAEILADPAKFPVFTGNADNMVLRSTPTLPSNNEWHQVMVQESRTDWNVSKTLVDKLTALNDTRLAVYAQPNKDGRFIGVPNGLPDAIATTFLATGAGLGASFLSPSAPSVVMTYAELQFTLAEAALDGDIAGGDAKTYFEKGIQASFDQHGLKVPATYISDLGAATKEKIMEQKWIALFGQGVEAWTEYRRTGLPVLPTRDARAFLRTTAYCPPACPTRPPKPRSTAKASKRALNSTAGATT